MLKSKLMDFYKAIKDLNHDLKVLPAEGIKKKVAYIKWFYRINY